MIEVEVKVHIEDTDALESKLEEIGARLVQVERQVDQYYNAPDRDFRITDEALRMRRTIITSGGKVSGGKADSCPTITYKGAKLDGTTKSREEIAISIDDPDSMHLLLTSLGYTTYGSVVKTRRRYGLGDYTPSIDVVEGLGLFMELECGADEENFDERRAGLIALLNRLGFSEEDSIRESYLELLSRK